MNTRLAVAAIALNVSLAAHHSLEAQAAAERSSDSSARWSVLVPGGTIVPTGEQRHAIKRGNVTALQVSYLARPNFAITSTFGWGRSRDIASADDPKLDVFTYDAGVEARAPKWIAREGADLTPFIGAGAGGRSYNYRALDVDATHNVAGYLSGGAELRIRRVGVRLEARDYVAGFKPLNGVGDSRMGNDVVVMAGLRLGVR